MRFFHHFETFRNKNIMFYIFSKKTRRQLAKEIFGESDTSQSQDKNNENNKDDKAITTDKTATENVSGIRRKIYFLYFYLNRGF